MSSVDYLTNDPIIPDNQKYCCLSLFMMPNKKDIQLMKVSGAFNTVEEAQEQIQLLKEPGHYNFVAEIGSWNAFDPLPNSNNLNDQLNNMMQRYLVLMHRRDYEYNQRKYTSIIKNYNENIQTKMSELNGYEENKDTPMIEKTKSHIKSLEDKVKEYEEKLELVNKQLEEIVIDSKYETTNNDTVNQNVPLAYQGKVNRNNEKIDGQNWYCVSFLTEEGKSLVGIKISGCFDTEENAKKHSDMLRNVNNSFDILVGELYKWYPFNPSPDSQEAGESEYCDEQLNKTMKKKKENEQKAKLYHEFRKNEEIKKNLEDMIHNKKAENEKNSKNLEKMKNQDMRLSIEKEISDIDKLITKLEEKMVEYSNKGKELSDQIGMPGRPDEPAKINIPKTMEL